MLKAKKKITKKELKQDALVSSYNNFLVYYEDNKKMIGYIVTAVIVLAIVFVVYINNRSANNEKAATELGKIFSYYDASASDPTQYQIAINGIPERNVTGLKGIVDNYGSTKSGEIAKLYLANAYYATGNIEDALKYFEDFSSGDPLLKASSIAGTAACYESKKDYDQAASYYEKASDMKTINAAEYLQDAARCFGLKGDKAKALSLCKRIKKEYPKSTQARDIDRFISQYSS